MRDLAPVERRVLRSALYATNANKAAAFPGDHGIVAGQLASDGLLEFDSLGSVNNLNYFTITQAGRVAYLALGDDDKEAY